MIATAEIPSATPALALLIFLLSANALRRIEFLYHAQNERHIAAIRYIHIADAHASLRDRRSGAYRRH